MRDVTRIFNVVLSLVGLIIRAPVLVTLLLRVWLDTRLPLKKLYGFFWPHSGLSRFIVRFL